MKVSKFFNHLRQRGAIEISRRIYYFKTLRNIRFEMTNPRRRSLLVAAFLLILALAPLLWWQLRHAGRTQAATMQLTTDGTGITIDVANRYRAIMHTNDSNRFIDYYDRSESDSSPDNTQYSFGPWIIEGGTAYGLTLDDSRKTTILEVTATRIRVRVEGCLDTSAGGACLTDGSNTINVIEDYTFTPFGVYVNSQIDFQSSGVALDSSGSEDGFVWAHLKTDITDGAFDDSASPAIYYGDGETESSTTTDGVAFEDTNNYVTLPGNGNYQSVFVSVPRSGWFDMSGGTDDWYYDENDSGTGDEVYTREQGTTPTGVHHYAWQVHFMDQANLDTEAEREALANDLRNPDLPTYSTGSQWTDGGAVAAGSSPAGASSGLDFNTSNYIDMGDDDAFSISATNQFTVGAWVNFDAFTAQQRVISKRLSGNYEWMLHVPTDGSVRSIIYNDSSGTMLGDLPTATKLSAGQWFHIAMTVDLNAPYHRIYINGVQESEDTTASGTYETSTASPLRVGLDGDGNNGIDGRVDDVRLYNVVLDQAEIVRIMSGDESVKSTNIVGHWNFNENTGSTAHDSSDNGNHGTITGATWTTGYVPDQYNEAEGAYTFNLASGNRGVFDLDGGPNVSTLLNGAATAGASSVTVDSTTGFNSASVAWIDGDKYSHTGTTATTFTGIPSSGDLSVIGHADNTVVASMNRHNPFYKLRNWVGLGLPQSLTMEGKALTIGTDYNASLKPVSVAYWAQDLYMHYPLESTTVGVGDTSLTNSGCSFVAAKYGKGLECNSDAADASVGITEGTDYEIEKGTVDFWLQPKFNHDDNNAHHIFKLRDAGTDDGIHLFKQSGTNDLIFRINQGASNIDYVVDTLDYSWKAGDWLHVRLEWDDTEALSSQQRVYINGVELTHTDSGTDFDSSLLTSPGTLFLGNQNGSDTAECNCIIDEFMLYNSDTTLTQLAVGGNTASSSEYLASETNDYTFSFTAVDGSNRGEYLWIGSDSQFQGLNTDLATLGVDSSAVMTWEYWNGTSWSTLTTTDQTTGASKFTASGNFYWTAPGNWFPYSVNGSTDLYYIRGHLASGSYTTTPVENLIKTDILLLNYLSNLSAPDQTLAFPSHTGSAADSSKGGPPLSHWSMDEAYGTTISDRIGDNHLTASGATWTITGAGMQPNQIYLQFDGSNDYLSRSYDGEFDFTTDSFTVSGWFRHSSTISGTDTLVARATAVNGIGWKVYMNSSGYLCFGIDDTAGTFPEDSACTGAALGSLADSRWHHFSAVKNGTAAITIYVDGLEIGSDTSLGSDATLSGYATLYIGIDADGTSNPWDGFIDNIVVYHYARSAAQVKADFNGQIPQSGVSF